MGGHYSRKYGILSQVMTGKLFLVDTKKFSLINVCYYKEKRTKYSSSITSALGECSSITTALGTFFCVTDVVEHKFLKTFTDHYCAHILTLFFLSFAGELAFFQIPLTFVKNLIHPILEAETESEQIRPKKKNVHFQQILDVCQTSIEVIS